MAKHNHGAEAVQIANEIEAICRNRPTVSVLLALSMVIGAGAADAERPDFDEEMRLIKKTARAEFDRRMRITRPAGGHTDAP